MAFERCQFCGSFLGIGKFRFDSNHNYYISFLRFDDRNAVPVYNEDASRSYPRNPIYLLYTNYERPVDTFLLIGGMLACWSLLNALDKFVVGTN